VENCRQKLIQDMIKNKQDLRGEGDTLKLTSSTAKSWWTI
jgi:hypothetical protein